MSSSAISDDNEDRILPSMIVFDLDDCLWTPEMHELPGKPSKHIKGILGDGTKGVVGMAVGKYGQPTVKLFDGARRVLYELATKTQYRDIILAAASTSLEPSYSQLCLEGLEIRQGVSLASMLSFQQIGRTGVLSSDKRSHFRLIHQESQINYQDMLFFDDCNWGDHVGIVQREFGVVGQRTPVGLDWHHFQEGLERFQRQRQRLT